MTRWRDKPLLPSDYDVAQLVALARKARGRVVEFDWEFNRDDLQCFRRAGRGVLVEPVFTDVSAWFAELDRLASGPFMPQGRQQPRPPERDVFE